jgi:drug/metabolite transporter (DMT)-like permease
MCFAILSRISFVLLNNSFLQVPRLASISTTLTTFVTLLSLAFVVFANFFFLNEKLNTQQLIGAVIILVGIIVIVK